MKSHILVYRQMLIFRIVFMAVAPLSAKAQPEYGAKPPLDTDALGKWRYVSPSLPVLSPHGRFVWYSIEDPRSEKTVVLQDTAGAWRQMYVGLNLYLFSDDERWAIFLHGDSLHFIDLKNNERDKIIRVSSARVRQYAAEHWLAYQEKEGKKDLVLLNLATEKEERLGEPMDNRYNFNGKALFFSKKTDDSGNIRPEIWWVELERNAPSRIWRGEDGEQITDMQFDRSGQRISFVVRNPGGKRELWYYKAGMAEPERRLSEIDSRLQGYSMAGGGTFSNNGRWLFVSLKALQTDSLPIGMANGVKVDIWSYKDPVIQPDQAYWEKEKASRRVTAVIEAEGKVFRLLGRGAEQLQTRPSEVSGDFVVLGEPDTAGPAVRWGRFRYKYSFSILSLTTGQRRWLSEHVPAGNLISAISPDGKWIVYYDWEHQQYMSFEMASGKVHHITKGLPGLVSEEYPNGVLVAPAAPIGGWIREKDQVLIYDNYDLWALDPGGHLPPLNITGGYGRLHGVKLRLMDRERVAEHINGESVLLTGFNPVTGENGFFRQIIGRSVGLEVLTMGPYLYYREPSQTPDGQDYDHGMAPVKASGTDCWVLERQTAAEAPNYFITTDWKYFRPLTDLAPQAGYNWLKAERMKWRQLDGTVGLGVLYKPENFDASKKYPIIFTYYEQLSQRLHEFPRPQWISDDLDIAWFVSRGYLVFTPDIHNRIGKESGKAPGWWAYNSVVSAAECLAKLPYVDGRRMGLQGHSFGGLETNYLVTHTHLFAAAAEFSGVTDLVGMYLGLRGTGTGQGSEDHLDSQEITEVGQIRMDATLWERPDLYLEQSVVLRADRVTTPLFMVHNKKDGAVPWRQGVEFHLALRRLGRRSWMLQYDEGGHGVKGGEARDYTIRLTQFFDYYLKGALPPKWMTEGVPARMKGIDAGYELDTSGKIP